jgi:hypothetical protein
VRRKLATLAVLATSLIALSGTAASAEVAAPIHAVKVCSTSYAGYVTAHLPWGVKCLHAGEFCKVGNRAYLRYGFVCPTTGHLKRR